MPRATHSVASRRRKRRMIEAAEGYWGKRKNLFRRAKETVRRALMFSYRDRRNRKREFRSLWIARINAACRAEGVPYSRFMKGLRDANVLLNRKVLADLAVHDETAFKQLIVLARPAAASSSR